MSEPRWMIYGAYGYTGELIAREARRRGMRPVLAGRRREPLVPLAEALECPFLVLDLADAPAMAEALRDVSLVLHCAGPFSETSPAMVTACLAAGVHYLDITGEIAVFEAIHSRDEAARKAGIVLCPGVGFDVIPTDCMAGVLHEALPSATELALGFDTRGGISPGTAKTSVEGLKFGGRVRREGRIEAVSLAWRERRIDFGAGEKMAATIPWGDVSTAFHSTGIPNIEVYMAMSPRAVRRLRRLRFLRPLLATGVAQGVLKRQVERRVTGPDAAARARDNTYVWGEVRDAAGEVRRGVLVTANGYEVTVHGSLAVVERLLNDPPAGGAWTPSKLMGNRFVESLPGSTRIEVAGEQGSSRA